ncbi:MAG: hypothetical protein WDZ84_11150 [Rhodovibrionaceae bacterium]
MQSDLRASFAELGLQEVVDAAAARELAVNEKFDAEAPYKPELEDLFSLHSIVQRTGRTTVLEFGCGWSSLLFAASLSQLRDRLGSLEAYRRNDPFACHCLDNMERYIAIARDRIPEAYRAAVTFHHSPVRMTQWNGRIATEYQTLPLCNPDLIYLDAPDQPGVLGEIDGWSTRHRDLMPMSCDILKIEHFLTPKTVIIVDGRAANARFLKCNLQRDWAYRYCARRDQHFFVLEEPPLGKYSKAIIEEVYYRDGSWTVEDL